MIEAILSAGEGRHAAEYEAFREKFCPYDDGRAAARVVDRIFGR